VVPGFKHDLLIEKNQNFFVLLVPVAAVFLRHLKIISSFVLIALLDFLGMSTRA
jgi:hypothetical protein